MSATNENPLTLGTPRSLLPRPCILVIFGAAGDLSWRKLLPAVRRKKPGTVVVAAGTSCRHQVLDFTGQRAIHPAVLLRSLLIETP